MSQSCGPAHVYRKDTLIPAPASAADWQTRYYHADHIGSVRRLTNEAGQITDGYTYTAFGELLAHTGADPQPYAFTGEPYDPNVGFQYHRARWMDPRVGRFVGMDPWRGSGYQPVSLHRYQYAADGPVNNVDPTGESTLTGILVGLAVFAILYSIATISTSVYNYGISDVPVSISTQPVILKESTWTEASAQAALGEAADIWFNVARVHMTWSQPIVVEKADPGLLDFGPSYVPLSSFLPEWGKHMTIFNRSIAGGEGGGFGAPLDDGVRAAALLSEPNGLILAHEWGHTLKMEHTLFRWSLMGTPADIFTSEFLTPEQRRTARQNARTLPWFRP